MACSKVCRILSVVSSVIRPKSFEYKMSKRATDDNEWQSTYRCVCSAHWRHHTRCLHSREPLWTTAVGCRLTRNALHSNNNYNTRTSLVLSRIVTFLASASIFEFFFLVDLYKYFWIIHTHTAETSSMFCFRWADSSDWTPPRNMLKSFPKYILSLQSFGIFDKLFYPKNKK